MPGKMRYGGHNMKSMTTTGARQTQKIAAALADELSRAGRRPAHGASVVALRGDLGAGKTTFVQGFARALGVGVHVLSPTFVLMKIYELKRDACRFRRLVHMDCYRITSAQDLAHLGFGEMLADKDNVILVEWADRIKEILPPDTLWLDFAHGDPPSRRTIVVRPAP